MIIFYDTGTDTIKMLSDYVLVIVKRMIYKNYEWKL